MGSCGARRLPTVFERDARPVTSGPVSGDRKGFETARVWASLPKEWPHVVPLTAVVVSTFDGLFGIESNQISLQTDDKRLGRTNS